MRVLAAAALIAGALLRIALLPIATPAVDDSWRAWSYHAATRGPWNLYGPKGHTVTFAGIEAPVVYPPLALDEFAILGRAHLAIAGGRFENDAALTRTIKGAIALLDAGLAALIFLAVRRAAGAASAWWAALSYWANPAVLMASTLGYVDVFFAIPAVAAVLAASYGRPWITGALFTAAVLTKPQGLFVGPVLVLALWHNGAGAAVKRVRDAVAASALTAAIVAAPVAAAGHTWDMLRSIAVLAGHDAISALAFNLWWIAGYLFQAFAVRSHGLRAALRLQPELMTHAQAMAHGAPHPRIIGLILLGAAVLWGLKICIRARDLATHAALAAFIVAAYFTLSVQVHENHFFLALPLLSIAAALRRELAPVFAALSVVWALNLYFVDGFYGAGAPEAAATFTGMDTTVILAVITCALFGWFAAVIARLPQPRPTT